MPAQLHLLCKAIAHPVETPTVLQGTGRGLSTHSTMQLFHSVHAGSLRVPRRQARHSRVLVRWRTIRRVGESNSRLSRIRRKEGRALSSTLARCREVHTGCSGTRGIQHRWLPARSRGLLTTRPRHVRDGLGRRHVSTICGVARKALTLPISKSKFEPTFPFIRLPFSSSDI